MLVMLFCHEISSSLGDWYLVLLYWGISCELVILMAILCCVYSYDMKSEIGSLYGNCILLFCEYNVES